MLINGVEYRVRVTSLPHFLNGLPSPCFVDFDAKEVLLSDTAGPVALAMLAIKAAAVIYAQSAPPDASPAQQPKARHCVTISGCFGVSLIYPEPTPQD